MMPTYPIANPNISNLPPAFAVRVSYANATPLNPSLIIDHNQTSQVNNNPYTSSLASIVNSSSTQKHEQANFDPFGGLALLIGVLIIGGVLVAASKCSIDYNPGAKEISQNEEEKTSSNFIDYKLAEGKTPIVNGLGKVLVEADELGYSGDKAISLEIKKLTEKGYNSKDGELTEKDINALLEGYGNSKGTEYELDSRADYGLTDTDDLETEVEKTATINETGEGTEDLDSKETSQEEVEDSSDGEGE